MAKITYNDCLISMFKLQRFGIKLGLDLISHILSTLGNPQKRFSAIHIAGTNGKGSVAAILSTIFQKAGIRVGCYTSPHLQKFNERIKINNQPISDDDVVAAYLRVKSVPELDRSATFFEFATAMAFDEFGRQGVEWAIVETGMGGRLDATNILTPDLSIITNISMEHRDYLGNTIYAIAGEKAGIIKPEVPVITGVKQKSARRAVQEKAERVNADVYQYGEAFYSRRNSKKAGFDYYGINHHLRRLDLGLQGDFQIDNASLVLAGYEILASQGKIAFSEESIRYGLQKTRWPGRLEVVSQNPLILLDGAHNLMSARMLGNYLADHYGDRHITLVTGVLDDKPYRSILKDLITPCSKVILTQAEINRAMPVDQLLPVASALGIQAILCASVADAVKLALEISTPDGVICIAGSLYVVGEAKTALSAMGIT